MTPTTHTAPTRAPLFRPVHPLGAPRPDMLAALRAGVLAEAGKSHALFPLRIRVLLSLAEGASDFSDLAAEMRVTKPALCQSLKRLGDMVTRRRAGLRCVVSITITGLARLNAIRDAMDAEVAL